jgi:hypothetical protein
MPTLTVAAVVLPQAVKMPANNTAQIIVGLFLFMIPPNKNAKYQLNRAQLLSRFWAFKKTAFSYI